jgi:hypothetical protein
LDQRGSQFGAQPARAPFWAKTRIGSIGETATCCQVEQNARFMSSAAAPSVKSHANDRTGKAPFNGNVADVRALFSHIPKRHDDMADDEELNPKNHPTDNAEKDPDDWVTGDEPMTGAQHSYLKTLSEKVHDPDAYAEDLSKAEASKRIDALREKAGLD